jgi:hypothetical protein
VSYSVHAPAPAVRATGSGSVRGLALALVGIAVTAYVASSPPVRDGLELMWLVPLAFTVCAVLFANIITYHRGGVGLKVLYCIIVIRYLVSPAMIVATNGEVAFYMRSASASGYRFSSVVTAVELFVCCATISFAWRRVRRRHETQTHRTSGSFHPSSTLTLGGVLVIALLTAIIAMRGLQDVMSTFGFLMITERYSEAVTDSYAVTAIQVLKSFVFVGVAALCQRRYAVVGNHFWFLAAALVALVNITTYFGYNRSLVLQTAIATIATLAYLFPSHRRTIALALVPVSGLVLYSLVALKQFGVSAASGRVSEELSLKTLSSSFENYVNGAWPLATAFDAAGQVSSRVDIAVILRTYTDNFFLFKVPFFTLPNDIFAGFPSVIDLYQAWTGPDLGAMLPLSAEMWFYGGGVAGPLFVLVGNVLAFYLLVQVDFRSKYATGAQARFLYSWTAALFGLTMCYGLVTIWWSFSKFAFFLIIVFWINNNFVLRRTEERSSA